MALTALSTEEVLSRMREITSRAQALRDRATASGSTAISGFGNAVNGTDQANEANFASVLRQAVRGVSDAQQTAQAKSQAYQLGDDKVTLEDVMISMQRASLAMQGMVQVRNRLVESYREVMNMQV